MVKVRFQSFVSGTSNFSYIQLASVKYNFLKIVLVSGHHSSGQVRFSFNPLFRNFSLCLYPGTIFSSLIIVSIKLRKIFMKLKHAAPKAFTTPFERENYWLFSPIHLVILTFLKNFKIFSKYWRMKIPHVPHYKEFLSHQTFYAKTLKIFFHCWKWFFSS